MEELTFGPEPIVFEHKGHILFNYCFNLKFYSLNMSTPEQKEAILRIFDDYVYAYGSRMNWTVNPIIGRGKKLNGNVDNYMTPHDWLMAEPEKNGYSFVYHGGKKRKDSSDISFMAMAEPWYGVDRHDLSTLSCRFPLRDVLCGAVDLPALMRQWCSLLKPHHAHGGYFAGDWYEYFDELPTLHAVRTDALMRYPGLQFEYVSEGHYNEKYQSGLYDGPRCADWLVALSDHFLEQLGGLDAVTEKMNPCPVLPYPGGAVLQAGDAPSMGRDGDPESLPDYMRLGRVIEPVRAKNLHYVLYIPDPTKSARIRNAQELTDKWCTRFSGMDVE